MWQADLWAEHGADKVLVAGVIDVKGRDAEEPGIVAARIRTLLGSVAPEQLWLSADCGFSQTARPLAVAKMRALVEAARDLRDELA
jgi:5-methyltetrahydropteroyltriglutamate--homocysteine methyltransferase